MAYAETLGKGFATDLEPQDPVSEKERTRMAAIYKIQQNRNPFIDYPELVEFIWGNKQGQPWSAVGGEYPTFHCLCQDQKLILERLFLESTQQLHFV